ncbi:hypothetical protein [Isoptericola croceus]|uniref:hypothetical protein n=1 Tax=Isoptericola croceus TaxID=3031406 RepID=UPI0023F84F8E|nr:hypothetical protein [Isoptericola croceus]
MASARMRDVRVVAPTTSDASGARGASDANVPGIRRVVESWLAVAGMALATVFLGGFALVVNRTDEQDFLSVLYPAMRDAGITVTSTGATDAFDAARTLAAWFGLTLMAVLFLGVVGVYAARRRPARRATGWWFLASGLACLFGSQLVLYPVAFLFFLAAGMFALRTSDRTSDRSSDTRSTA